MAHLTKPSSFVVGLLTVALVCSGCRDRTEKPKQDSTALASAADSGPLLLEGYSAPFIEPLRLLDGEVDRDNHYLSTVRLKADSPAIRKECAGVLIESRWVLTAAHCVCMPQTVQESGHEGKTLLNSSACAAAVTVTAVAYLPPLPGGGVSTLNEGHRGTVRPHPGFEIVLNTGGRLKSSRADLALILLDEPVKSSFPPVKLATTEARNGEPLVLAGYGDDESGKGGSDDRRFSRHRVVDLPNAGGDLLGLERPSRPAYQDDNGGPCLREANGKQVLVGISHRGLGTEPACTSIHVHEEWIREELKHSTSPNRSTDP